MQTNARETTIYKKRIMAGIYIHIPFCGRKCYYCSFYSTSDTRLKAPYIKSVLAESTLRKEYLQGEILETIYIGGGTPSLLNMDEIVSLFDGLKKNFSFEHLIECTIELNPESVNASFLEGLRKRTPINRLSMGVQSFFEDDLRLLNRKHSAEDAFRAVNEAKRCGFNNFSIDLIYGLPTLTEEKWQANLAHFFSFDIPHLSAYALTIEENSILEKMIKSGKYPNVNEEQMLRQYEILQYEIEKNGYQGYEISNYSKIGKHAIHNTNYWKMKPYLGLGAAAHSYDGKSREWNVENVATYVTGLEQEYKEVRLKEDNSVRNLFLEEREYLSDTDRYNEYVMTGLRTIWGIEKEVLEIQFGKKSLELFKNKIQAFIKEGVVDEYEKGWRLTKESRLMADGLARALFE